MSKTFLLLSFVFLLSSCYENEHSTVCDNTIQIRKGGSFYIAHFNSALNIFPQANCDSVILYKNYEVVEGYRINDGFNLNIAKPDTYAIQPFCFDSASYANFEYNVTYTCDE